MMIAEYITPVTILFIVIIVGVGIGKIKIFNISLDLSAVLLTAIMVGFIISRFIPSIIDENFNSTIKTYSSIGTALFVSVVAMNSGFSLKLTSKKTFVYISLGAFNVLCSFICFYLLKYLVPEFDKSILLGILCGSLTSTPGLSAVCARLDVIKESAIVGYGTAYLIGVSLTVLFVQFVAVVMNSVKGVLKKNEKNYHKNAGVEGLMAIGIVATLGELIGKISFLNYSIGSTGGILVCGIIAGMIINKFPKIKNSVSDSFNFLRTFGLILFFVGNGISAGYCLNTKISIKWLVFSVIITLTVLFFSLFVCKLLSVNTPQILAVLSGGMTSTPALGILIKKGYSIDMCAYSLSYFGALVTITIGMSFIKT